MITILQGLSETEIVRLFSWRFRGWQDSNGRSGSKQPCWYSDSKLEVSIKTWLFSNSQKDAETFARYCLINLGNENVGLASKHLSAFLENISYNIAKSVLRNLRERQDNNRTIPLEKSLEEIYQYAWLAASNPEEFFCHFQSETPYLVNYTTVKIKGVIKDGIFAKNNTRMTAYGMLRKLGPRQRKNALQLQGYTEPSLSQYCLAWECFSQICTAVHGRISPTDAHWQAITKQYNRLKKQLPAPTASQNLDSTTIKKWLDSICITAATRYLFPRLESIDILNEDINAPRIELTDLSSLPSEILEQEEVNEIARKIQINFSLIDNIESLEKTQKIVLFLRYGLKMTQVEVAQEMLWLDRNNRPINSTVSRCEDRAIVNILREITTWVKQEQDKNNYPSDVVLSQEKMNLDWLREMEIKPAVESLLSQHYLTLVNSLLNTAPLSVEFTSQQITELLSLKRNNENTILFVQRMSEVQNNQTIAISLLKMHQRIIQQMQTHFNITLQVEGKAAERVMILILDLLKIHSPQ
ncbi:hypothetical protein F7734_36035 [Scytonema sp. UIC 10036]|uniref:hypothetical protein n=1 Tax=Scytonema sp. UIC 10036 TaxID=2304196 RepID=UPI0012DA0BBB|nr:hypothetical protein [Scytonema sp. UIC 10036]MUG97448.1 hypothetical protein [Scytonema sp. UIC 10036]